MNAACRLAKELYRVWRVADLQTFSTYLVNVFQLFPAIVQSRTFMSVPARGFAPAVAQQARERHGALPGTAEKLPSRF
jgi:hypothetical protein